MPLDRERRQIRLVHLAPSTQLDEQPCCSLEIVSLDEDPQYDALSYVWGDPNITTPIRIRSTTAINVNDEEPLGTDVVGIEHSAGLPPPAMNKIQYVEWPVTTNLEAAMRYLRHKTVERILWIDAISIKQSNIEERNHQVQLMKSIYSNAAIVRIWLGTPIPGSDEAILILKEIGKGVLYKDTKLQGRCLNEKDFRPIIDLMTRPWWGRTWVLQELLLAKEAIFYCGFESIAWRDLPSLLRLEQWFYSGVKLLQLEWRIMDELFDSFNSYHRIRGTANQLGGSATVEGFIVILALNRQSHRFDERDAVYGLLGLMNNDIASNIIPDYNTSAADIFQDVTVQLTLCSQSLILFSLTQYKTKQDRGFPTWVPSWHTLSGCEDADEWGMRSYRLAQQAYYCACAEYKIKFEIVDKKTARLLGARLDCIVRKSSVLLSSYSQRAAGRQHRECRLLCDLENDDRLHYIACGEASEVFHRTMLNDIYRSTEGIVRPYGPGDYKAYAAWLDELEDLTPVCWKSELASTFYASYRLACLGRSFFFTKKGYFGTGPAELKEGDEIYILAGGKLPLVLRPFSDAPPYTFELIGDCYVHGVMNGEAVSDHWSSQMPKGEDMSGDEGSHGEPRCGQSHDPDLPLRDFHDVFLV